MAAAILLGIGGAKLFEQLGWQPEIYHLNESYGLPLAFHLYSRFRDKQHIEKMLQIKREAKRLLFEVIAVRPEDIERRCIYAGLCKAICRLQTAGSFTV
jgi:hypothetical protein